MARILPFRKQAHREPPPPDGRLSIRFRRTRPSGRSIASVLLAAAAAGAATAVLFG